MPTFYCDGSQTRICYTCPDEKIRKVIPLPQKATVNEAEYLAIIAALEAALAKGFETVDIFSDSQLAIRQLNGEYATRQPRLAELGDQVWDITEKFYEVTFTWLPRWKNPAGIILG